MATSAGKFEGQDVQELSIAGACGSAAKILSYGATLSDLVVPVGNQKRRVVLGFRSLQGYVNDRSYIGASVGRCINRIADGRFTLDGKTYQAPTNGGPGVHLHGGDKGLTRRVWRVTGQTANSASFAITSPDGEEGYPGKLDATCTYRIDAPGTLSIEMTATCDAPTIANLGHHSYFTLQPGSDVRDHTLQVDADFFTPLNEKLVPNGEIRSVTQTAYDFRKPQPIGANRGSGLPEGYDINFVLNQGWLPPLDKAGRGGDALPVAARLISPSGDLTMELMTTEPGLQFYEGIRLAETPDDLPGEPHKPYRGLCLEPQRLPDSINRPHFSKVILRPGETYRQISRFRFVAS